ncbi:MAG: amidohydrolase family protein, partial [Gammaproteobacteria bacterium]
ALLALSLHSAAVAAAASCDRAAPADLAIREARAPGPDPGTFTIVISGDRICAVERASETQQSAVELDARGLTVLPGLIDAHVHMFPMGSRAGIDSDAELERYVRDELPGRLQEYLQRGVTTLFSVGDAWPAIRDLRRRIDAGDIAGPRLLITGPILTAPGGYPATTICADNAWCRSRLTVELRDVGHARWTVRELAAGGVDAVKMVFDGARGKKLDANLIRVVASEARALGLPVVAHATRVDDALEVTELGADILAHIPSDGTLDPAAAAELARRGVAVLTTAGVYAPLTGSDGVRRTVFGLRYGPPFDHLYSRGLRNARMLAVHGVRLAFGSGTPMFRPSQSLDGELAALSGVLLTRSRLIDAMTIDAARALHRESDLGSVEAGKRADLLLVGAEQFDSGGRSFSDVLVVIRDGRIVVDRRAD